ncbi:hypothetical protein IFR05_008027 [Cadophora sp. M221]|nr:hypothetical protein IFR05_008027 [Cadophora sp. M221]
MKLSALLFGVLATGFTTAQFCDVLFCRYASSFPREQIVHGGVIVWDGPVKVSSLFIVFLSSSVTPRPIVSLPVTMSNPGRRGWGTVNAWEKEAGITETAAGKHSNGYVDETRFDVDAPEAAEKRGPGPRKIEEGKKARV